MKLLKYALRELKNNRRFCLLFVFNLSLGLTGFVALDGFKTSLDYTIKGRSKAVLGADFGISARRPIEQAEVRVVEGLIDKNFESSAQVEVFSMVANQDRRSRLVQIKAIEENFPFYGEIELEEKGVINKELHQNLRNDKKIWIYPELIRQLGVKVGDSLFIGETEFQVDDVVKADAAAGISTNMAPRIYMNKVHLSSTGLIKKGTVAWYSVIYRLQERSGEQLADIRDKTFKILDSPEIRVYTHENVSAQMTALIARLNDFLGLSSLVALFLAAVGSAFLFRSYFKKRIKQVATLICLGTPRWQAFGYYLFQVVFLGALSALVAAMLSVLLVPGLGGLTKDLIPFDIQFTLNPSTLFLGLVVGSIGSFLICLPILVNLLRLKPSLLFTDERQNEGRWNLLAIFAALPGVLLFSGLAIWLANSYQVGGLFVALFFGAGLFLGVGSLVFFSWVERGVKPKSLSLRWALRDLARNRFTTLTCFVAIGLGALLLNLIPQLQKSLETELARPEQSKLPSLFMFDIQEEQLSDFRRILKEKNVVIDQISPMIRARLISVNSESFDKGEGLSENFSREEEREMRFRNRGFNLTYRDQLSNAESIVEGVDFSGTFDEEKQEHAEISVEQRFAARLGLKVGDILEFDIESIPVTGKVVNLRSVKWTSFRPNFFVQFQPGVLEIAPKTFVATVPNLTMERKYELQDALVESLPNISMVDVSRVVQRISGMMEQMSWALIFMSLLCLFAGFVVIYSIANHQSSVRSWEVGLLKSLGSPFGHIRGQFLWQFALVAFMALSLGAGISLAISYILSTFLFDSLWAFDWFTPLISVVGGTLITIFVTWIAIQGALSKPARDLFSDSQ